MTAHSARSRLRRRWLVVSFIALIDYLRDRDA